ncbi:MAG: hypothetical protein Q9159_004878 [Coniocarpon cinnabarinum]
MTASLNEYRTEQEGNAEQWQQEDVDGRRGGLEVGLSGIFKVGVGCKRACKRPMCRACRVQQEGQREEVAFWAIESLGVTRGWDEVRAYRLGPSAAAQPLNGLRNIAPSNPSEDLLEAPGWRPSLSVPLPQCILTGPGNIE